jgi:hypothetical protein
MKRKYLFIVVLLLIALVGVLVLSETSSTFTSGEKDFAIYDTAAVTKIFMADMDGSTVLLDRGDSDIWSVNNKYPAQKDMVKQFLRTLMYISVRGPVGTGAKDNVIRYMASHGIKVEIYQEKYLIDFLGIQLFKREKLTKTYYVGDNTMDNSGTYMKMADSDTPFIVYIPGFKGFLHTRFSTNPHEWRDHTVFNFFMKDIQSISMVYPQEPEKSFSIENPNDRDFILKSAENNSPIASYDTIRMINYMSGFYDARFERLINDPAGAIRDSLLALEPFQILVVTPKNGKAVEMATYLIPNSLTEEEQEARYFESTTYPWDRERMYAFINGGEDLVSIQYFVFARILKPIQFFSTDYRDVTIEGLSMYELTSE